jgi:hypothetical protein
VEGEGDVAEKKPRSKKVAMEGENVAEKKPRAKKVVVEGGEPKRGRKPKEQIVELAQEHDISPVNEEESLDALIQSMNEKEESVSVSVPFPLEEIQVEDVDDILRELEAEEIIEPTVVTTPVIKKKGKKSSEDKEKSSEDKDKPKPVKKTKKNKDVVVDK